MLKRMNYIRQSIDSHQDTSAKETARQKKEERIMEIWKEDQAKPKVVDTVLKMKNLRIKHSINDFNETQKLPMIQCEDSNENSIFSAQ